MILQWHHRLATTICVFAGLVSAAAVDQNQDICLPCGLQPNPQLRLAFTRSELTVQGYLSVGVARFRVHRSDFRLTLNL